MREFLVNYDHAGSAWSLTVFADDEADAKRKVWAIRSSARYEGEVFLVIPVVPAWAGRLLRWFKR